MAKKKKKLTTGIIIGRVILVLLTVILGIALALTISLATIIKGPSESARDTFVTTVLESGNLKFLATVFLSEEEVNEIVAKTSMQKLDDDVDTELIDSETEVKGDFDKNGIEIQNIYGTDYTAVMMIVKDPSKVFVGTSYNNGWSEYGKNLDVLVDEYKAIGGVNGGLYAADMNKGGSPYGVCVSKGEIQHNKPYEYSDLYMIGFDKNNILIIQDINGWSSQKFTDYVNEQGIRDAVAFQDKMGADTNHFVPLIINGEARELSGSGSGANPRTAIGQRADGAVLLLVTDGRGSNGHLGATAADLISIMEDYGAVNAANLDGGSSTSMYYDNKYLKSSVTLYYDNKSWRLPTSFLVMGGGQ